MRRKCLAVPTPATFQLEFALMAAYKARHIPWRKELDKHQRLRVDGAVEVGGGEVEDIGGKDGVDECQHSGGREQTRDPHCER